MSGPIVLTCGEPAGIGPELAGAAWKTLKDTLPFFWLGDPAHLPSNVPIAIIEHPSDADETVHHALPVLPHEFDGARIAGQPNPSHAKGVIEVLERAVDLATSNIVGGICTAPIHKQALQDGANFAYPGHTEFLAALAGVDHVVMMLASEMLRVVPATIHIPLEQVSKVLTQEHLEATIRITHRALKQDFGVAQPRIAVAGLNPHAGEGGKMGLQEQEMIAPLLERLRADGISLLGPMSADTMFHAAARTQYDVAIAMYHDQALIPIKTLDFDRGVNVTLGLPFVRTSPDHGTAFDIAGQGRANPTSTIEALRLAAKLASRREQNA